jgi:hypothetical protein
MLGASDWVKLGARRAFQSLVRTDHDRREWQEPTRKTGETSDRWLAGATVATARQRTHSVGMSRQAENALQTGKVA